MTWTVEWSAAEATPDRDQVLRSQGLPEGEALPERLVGLVDKAFKRYLALAEPRSILGFVEPGAFEEIYRGEGLNAHETPLELIVPRASRLALFVATLGQRLGAGISELFAGRRPAEGYMLDAVASEAADDLACAAGRALIAHLEREGGVADGARVLPYSPGYCGWHVSGQRKLFAFLGPEKIGVTLNESCLMQPLKSVSGVLVVGDAATHRFRPVYPFCEQCGTRQCRERMASVT